MRYLLYITTMILLLSGASCQAKGKERERPKSRNREIRIVLKDSVSNKFPYDKERNYTALYPIRYKGANWILQGNTRSGYTALTGIDKANKGQYLVLDTFKKLKKEYKIQCFEYTSADSIWAVSPERQQIYLLNMDGKVSLTIPLNLNFNGKPLPLIARMRGWPFVYNSQARQLYYPILSIYGEDSLYFRQPKFAVIQLTQDSAFISRVFGAFPEEYTNQFLGYNNIASLCSFAGNLLINYYLSDSLYAYNGNTTTPFDAHSPVVSSPERLFDPQRSADKDYVNEFSFAYTAYEPALANSASPYLLRAIEHKYNYYNADSTINDPIDKPWNIVVIDTNLRIAGEINIPPALINRIEYMPYGKGFWAKSLQTDQYYYYEMQLDHL